jgi:low affinity Fe/Cu permease
MAVQLKLDELINSIKDARNELINVESLDEKELEEKREEMVQLAEEAQNAAEEVKDTAKSAAEGLVDHAKTAAEQLVETAEEVKKIPKG